MVFRCFGTGDPLYERYHDEEWGMPVVDERRLFEKLCLEAFQSGLSWITILRKREAFRRAFAGFDPGLVAGFGPADVERLLADPGIVRNRSKIEACVANAAALGRLHQTGGSLAALLWAGAPEAAGPPGPVPGSLAELPTTVPSAVSTARRLKAAGFRFVGPTTLYATLQACGIVNDHLAACPARRRVERERRRVLKKRPWVGA